MQKFAGYGGDKAIAMVKSIKESVISKRFLYTLCFIAFMFIDWTRDSQVGSTWACTVNMTGVVMAVILFSAYSPKEFLKPAYVVYSVISVIALGAAYYWRQGQQTAIFAGQLLTAILNIWLLGIFIIKLFLETVVYKTRKLHFCKTEIVVAVMLLWMLFSVNEDIWPIWYLVIFGLFYHTDNKKEDREALREGMLDGIITSFFLLQGSAFVFRPFDDPHQRYSGIYVNCNFNAMFYGIVWIAFLIKLYDIRRSHDKKWKEVLCFLFVGVLTAFSILTISKTAWISMLITGFFYVIFADFHYLEYKAGKMVQKLVLYLAVTLICIPVTYGAVRYLPPVFHHPVWYEGEYSIDRVHSFDPWDSEKYVSWEEFSDAVIIRVKPFMEVIFGRYQRGMSAVQASNTITVAGKDYEKDSQTLQDFSSTLGRLAFWEYYLKNGNIAGHLSSEGHDIGLGFYVWHAQNMFVQFWYYYGIPSAVLFLMVLVMLIFSSIKKVIRNNGETMCCLLYLVYFSMYGLFEATWYPGQMILLLAFFVPKFLSDRRKTEDSCIDR